MLSAVALTLTPVQDDFDFIFGVPDPSLDPNRPANVDAANIHSEVHP